MPERLRALTAHETRLIASLRGAALDDAGVLELTGWAHPRLVDLAGQDVQVRAVLVQDGSGRRHELPVEPREDPEADLLALTPTSPTPPRVSSPGSTCARSWP